MKPYTELIRLLPSLDYPTVKKWDSSKKRSITYYNIEAGFDIETSATKTQDGTKTAFMYVWMVGIGFNSQVYYGNTWEEFSELCEAIQARFKLSDTRRFVMYVHNLGYEFQFMRKFFDFTSVFSAGERKPITANTANGIEFRDSYILSGYSLAYTAKNLTKNHVKKMVGDLDYSLIRTTKTPLTPQEIQYCINDIQIILAYINEEIGINGDITKIPMTNTGRVRKYVRDMCFSRKSDGTKNKFAGQKSRYSEMIQSLTLDTPTYVQLKAAFMGGFTHANANYTNCQLEDITSIDFTSSYPAVMVSEKFPMSKFTPITINSLAHFDSVCVTNAVVFDARFTNIRPRISQENYISESKCSSVVNAKLNNGRINTADSICCTLTEVDYDIMKMAYEWDTFSMVNVKCAIKDYLPKPIIGAILKLYQGKTELKDVAGSETEYLHSKGMLNSIYGMCVTDIVKDQATYEEDWSTTKPSISETIEKHNTSKNRFLYYPWGVWVTAYARYNLWTGIMAVGDDYVYSDTDSLKLHNYEKHKPYVDWFDTQIVNKMEVMCDKLGFDKTLLRPKTKHGVEKVLGIWDYEGTYPNFKTLGAKRYMVEDKKGITLTVAGLSKRNGIEYMQAQCNSVDEVFDMFADSLCIPADKTGKMTHTYIDEEMSFEVEDYLGVKTHINVLSGIHLENCEFNLSLSENYLDFLNNLEHGFSGNGDIHV